MDQAAPESPFTLSVKVIIRDPSGRVLLLRRSRNSRGSPGKWEFPGGKAELGEKFDEALLREVAEETALTIALTHVAGAVEHISPSRRLAYIIMEASLESGEVRLSSEHEDSAWVPLEQLPGMDLVDQFVDFAREYAGRRGLSR
jgi:mutator protein MutT